MRQKLILSAPVTASSESTAVKSPLPYVSLTLRMPRDLYCVIADFAVQRGWRIAVLIQDTLAEETPGRID